MLTSLTRSISCTHILYSFFIYGSPPNIPNEMSVTCVRGGNHNNKKELREYECVPRTIPYLLMLGALYNKRI